MTNEEQPSKIQGSTTPPSHSDEDPSDDLETDPATGSTPTDPMVDEVGPPPAGRDPMAGEAPSG